MIYPTSRSKSKKRFIILILLRHVINLVRNFIIVRLYCEHWGRRPPRSCCMDTLKVLPLPFVKFHHRLQVVPYVLVIQICSLYIESSVRCSYLLEDCSDCTHFQLCEIVCNNNYPPWCILVVIVVSSLKSRQSMLLRLNLNLFFFFMCVFCAIKIQKWWIDLIFWTNEPVILSVYQLLKSSSCVIAFEAISRWTTVSIRPSS